MTPVLPSPELPAVSVDRVRMIRRSMRCFVFGILGIVPILGMGTAALALRLWREVAEETGEPARLTGSRRYAIAALALTVAILGYDVAGLKLSKTRHLSTEEINLYYSHAGLLVVMGILLAARQAWLFFQQYRRVEPREWNPARHLAYWGVGLAYTGLILSSALIIFIVGCALLLVGR